MDETVIAREDGRSITFNIHKGTAPPAPFTWATFQYVIEDDPGGHTRVLGTAAA